MLIQTTQEFSTSDSAEDALAGFAASPGFVLGYVVSPRTAARLFGAVALFECREGPLARKQHEAHHLTVKGGGCFDGSSRPARIVGF